MATPALAKEFRRGFPKSLDGAPMLLHTCDTAIRRRHRAVLAICETARSTLFAEVSIVNRQSLREPR
jgi:hypothetical protein